uniref:Polo kinase n=1 Tax=Plectus sambesii TaxID=2011161 RepID=A0A914WVJ3_9BILA
MEYWAGVCSAAPAEAAQLAYRKKMAECDSEMPFEKNALMVSNDCSRKYYRGAFLGKGRTSSCVLLQDASTRKCFAGKMIDMEDLELLHPNRKRRLEREMDIHSEMTHPNIVRYEGYVDVGSYRFILLEYCSMRSLADLQRNRGTITEPEARFYVKQIASALMYMHDRSIAHRDLKSRNVLLDAQMQVKVCDFGLADYLHDRGTLHKLCGTRAYMAPEMLARLRYTTSVDIWSLGCILYQLLVGVLPFLSEQTTEEAAKEGPLRYRPILTPLSTEAREIIDALLNNAPERRPTARAIAFMSFMQGFTPATLPPASAHMPPTFDESDEIKVKEPEENASQWEDDWPTSSGETTTDLHSARVQDDKIDNKTALPNPELETIEQVCISWIDEEEEWCFWGQRLCDELAIEELRTRMTKFYSIFAKHEYRVSWKLPLAVPALCAVFDDVNNGWYRASYVAHISATKVKVLCIDYGNPLEVDVQDLKQLVERFNVSNKPPFSRKYRDSHARGAELSRDDFKKFILRGSHFKLLRLERKNGDVTDVQTFELQSVGDDSDERPEVPSK